MSTLLVRPLAAGLLSVASVAVLAIPFAARVEAHPVVIEDEGDGDTEPPFIGTVDNKKCRAVAPKPPETGCPIPDGCPKTANCAVGTGTTPQPGGYTAGKCDINAPDWHCKTEKANLAKPLFKCVKAECDRTDGTKGETCKWEQTGCSDSFVETVVCTDWHN